MNYYPDFDYYLIKERNERLLSETGTRWLEKRPQRDRRTSALRLIAFASKSRLPCFAGWGWQGVSSATDRTKHPK